MKKKETIVIPQINKNEEVLTVEIVKEIFSSVEQMKNTLLDSSDIVTIKWKNYINKKGYRKLAIAFNISTQIVSEQRIEKENILIYDFTIRAIAPSGRYTEASASCSSQERDFNHLDNDVRATSQTRACNRAISDLLWVSEIWKKQSQATSEKNQEIKTPRKRNLLSSSDEMITAKQKYLLIKLIESKYKDESSRNKEYKRLESFTKKQAGFTIREFLDEWITVT